MCIRDSLIRAEKQDDLLLDIISKATNDGISIQSVYTYSNQSDNTYEITVIVENKEKLVKYMNTVKTLNGIIECERLIK